MSVAIVGVIVPFVGGAAFGSADRDDRQGGALRRRRAHRDERRHHRPRARRPQGADDGRVAHRARRRGRRRRDRPRHPHGRRAARDLRVGLGARRALDRLRRGRVPGGDRVRRRALRARASSTGSRATAGRRARSSRSRSRSRSPSPSSRTRPKLAPIVGAFVAGLALGRSNSSDRIRRELQPVGHLFIPVFFLTIGIDVDVAQFAKPSVLGLAAVLLVIAVAGKLASAAGLIGAPGDRLLVGIGMIPRGEVGLIFATIGLSAGDHRAARLRGDPARRAADHAPHSARAAFATRASPRGAGAPSRDRRCPDPRGDGSCSPTPAARRCHRPRGARPPIGDALAVGLQAALMLDEEHRPGELLVEWLGQLPPAPLRFDRDARVSLFFELLARGRPRSWRFLQITGLLDRALPELGDAIRRREPSALDLDPFGALHWATLDAVHRELEVWLSEGRPPVDHPEWVELAAVVARCERRVRAAGPARSTRDAASRPRGDRRASGCRARGRRRPAAPGGAAARRVRRGDGAAARRPSGIASNRHDGYTCSRWPPTISTRSSEPALDALRELVEAAFAHPELTSRSATNTIEQRRNAAARLTDDPDVKARLAIAPRAYVLSQTPEALARQAALCEPRVTGSDVRVAVVARGSGALEDRARRRRPHRSAVACRERAERARLRHRGRRRLHLARRVGADELRSAAGRASSCRRGRRASARRACP